MITTKKLYKGHYKFTLDGQSVVTTNAQLYDDVETVQRAGGLDQLSPEEKESLFYENPIEYVYELIYGPIRVTNEQLKTATAELTTWAADKDLNDVLNSKNGYHIHHLAVIGGADLDLYPPQFAIYYEAHVKRILSVKGIVMYIAEGLKIVQNRK